MAELLFTRIYPAKNKATEFQTIPETTFNGGCYIHRDREPFTKGSLGAAGLDVYADTFDYPMLIEPGETKAIPTGIAIKLPRNHAGMLVSRSGLAKKGIIVVGGIIDPDYRGEIIVLLHNLAGQLGMPLSENSGYVVYPGERVAQLLIVPITRVVQRYVPKLDDTERGSNGFGSTGD